MYNSKLSVYNEPLHFKSALDGDEFIPVHVCPGCSEGRHLVPSNSFLPTPFLPRVTIFSPVSKARVSKRVYHSTNCVISSSVWSERERGIWTGNVIWGAKEGTPTDGTVHGLMPASTDAMQSGKEPFQNASGAKGMTALPWVQTIRTSHDFKTQWARKIVIELCLGCCAEVIFAFLEEGGGFCFFLRQGC